MNPTPAITADEFLALARRVAALEAAQASHSSGVSRRVSKAEAARLLCCSTRQVSRYAARGLLVPLPKSGSANTVTFYEAANVAALCESEDAAREWVARRKYLPAARRR